MKLPAIGHAANHHALRDTSSALAQPSAGPHSARPAPDLCCVAKRAARSLVTVQRAQQQVIQEMLTEAATCANFLQQPSAQWLSPQLLDTLQQDMACLQQEGSAMLLASHEHVAASEQAYALSEPKSVEACLMAGRAFVRAHDARLEAVCLALVQLHHTLAHGHVQSGPQAPPILPSYTALPVAQLSQQQRAEGFCPIMQLPLEELLHPVAILVEKVWHIFEYQALENYLQLNWPHKTGHKVYLNPLTRKMVPLHDLYRLELDARPKCRAE